MEQIWYTIFGNVVTVGLVCNLIHDPHHWVCWLITVMLDFIVGPYSPSEIDFSREEQLFLKLKLVPLRLLEVCYCYLVWSTVRLCTLSHMLIANKIPYDNDLRPFHTLCSFSFSFWCFISLFWMWGKLLAYILIANEIKYALFKC